MILFPTSPAPASGARSALHAGGTTRPPPVRLVRSLPGATSFRTRTWESRSQVVVAERGQEFAWEVGDSFVRWGYILTPAETGTPLSETWQFLPGGIAIFEEQYGNNAQSQIAERTQQALDGTPVTLAAIKRIAESIDENQETRPL